jgi:Tfp pilus assembly protein PilO
MGNLERARRRFISIVAVLGILDVVLIAYLVWPGTSPSARQAKEQALQQQLTSLMREVTPLRGIDKKLAQTRVDVKKFYEQKVPSEFSQISQHLDQLVRDAGVTTPSGIHYAQEKNAANEKNELPDVQRISVDTTVTGEYSKVARFINALEQDKFVFIINQITLNSAEGGGSVSLQIKFDTFLQGAS